jgi:hypothetical protein
MIFAASNSVKKTADRKSFVSSTMNTYDDAWIGGNPINLLCPTCKDIIARLFDYLVYCKLVFRDSYLSLFVTPAENAIKFLMGSNEIRKKILINFYKWDLKRLKKLDDGNMSIWTPPLFSYEVEQVWLLTSNHFSGTWFGKG